jgi:hypothetical protein
MVANIFRIRIHSLGMLRFVEFSMINCNLLKKNFKRLLFILLTMILWYCVIHVVGWTIEPHNNYSKWTYCASNIRSLHYSLVSFYFDHDYLIAYTVDENNKPLHSWRVLLLPYIEEEELYKKIRLDEPWNSEYNSQFHNYDIPIYRCPGKTRHKQGTTNYFFITGIGSAFDKSGKYFGDKSQITSESSFVDSFKAGVQKVLLVESSKEVNWMCPVDITFEEYKSSNFKPETEDHFNFITYDNFNIKIFVASFYWNWTKLGTFLICILLALLVIVVIQFCYIMILSFLYVRSYLMDKK